MHGTSSVLEVAEALESEPTFVRDSMCQMAKQSEIELADRPDVRVRYGAKYRLKQRCVPFTSFMQFARGPGLGDSVVAHTSPYPPGVPPALTEAGCSVWTIKKYWEEYYALQEQTETI